MFGVGKKVSFSLVIALLTGWGVFSVLFIKAAEALWQAEGLEYDQPVQLPPGVKLNLNVDKKVYKGGDQILISLRNDSRLVVWLAARADGCRDAWWLVEKLGPDGENWSPVELTKKTCPSKTFGLTKPGRHSLQNAEWAALVPVRQLGNVSVPAPTGTYRIAVPYLKSKTAVESDWLTESRRLVTSAAFAVQ